MLDELRIQNLGVIADATLPFSHGLTVLTGETGAGKTMVVAGLGLLFGGRGSRVPPSGEKTLVEGRLLTENVSAELKERAIAAGAELDDESELLLARSVNTEGRSRGWVGGRSAPIGVLAELGELTVSVHGQADQMRLLQQSEQRMALDRFAGEEHLKLLADYAETFTTLGTVESQLSRLRGDAREMAREADLLRLGIAEITEVDPQPGEEQALSDEARRLEHAESLRQAAQAAHQSLSGIEDQDTSGAVDLAGVAARSLEAQSETDAQLGDFSERLSTAATALAEVGSDLLHYLEELQADPSRLEEIFQRQLAIKGLLRKYAEDIDGVLEWADNARTRLAEVGSSDDRISELVTELASLTSRAAEQATAIRTSRLQAAEQFSATVSAELKNLAMPHATVEATVIPRPAARSAVTLQIVGEECGAAEDGADDIELLLRPHPGAPPAPLNKGASGGELSRVMLAIEVVFAGAGGPPVLVFDEVDAGVGGQAATEIGRCLARLARRHQVLVVTHLPQVAAFADRHLVVSKDTSGSVTVSGVQVVDDGQRARELARMLAGMPDSHLGVAHAEELLANATKLKSGK